MKAIACGARGTMSLERILMALAGTVSLIGVILAVAVSPWFAAIPIFVTVNQWLFAAAGDCPSSLLLRRFLPVERRGA